MFSMFQCFKCFNVFNVPGSSGRTRHTGDDRNSDQNCESDQNIVIVSFVKFYFEIGLSFNDILYFNSKHYLQH